MRVKVELYKNVKYIERFKYNNVGQQIALLDTPIEKEMEVCEDFLICEGISVEVSKKGCNVEIGKFNKNYDFSLLTDLYYSRIVAFVDGEEILNKELKKETE